jgi:hypothetical protein
MARIVWTCRIEAEPDDPLLALPEWSGYVTLSDMAPTVTMADIGRDAVAILGASFLERFLVQTGAAKMRGKYPDHSVHVRVVRCPDEHELAELVAKAS